jgi:hypothetical protein
MNCCALRKLSPENRAWHQESFFLTFLPVIGLLRFVGMLNAAVWLGAVIFFTFVAAPAFFSQEMLSFLPRSYAGAAAQVVIKRLFTLHEVCGVIALLHLTAEWLYTGRPLQRFTLGLLLGLLALVFCGNTIIRPKLEQLHLTMYAPGRTSEQREQARKSFGAWHGLSQVSNFIILSGLLIYFSQVAHPLNTPRFFSLNKFRG